uniref:Zona pellucida sperm-binding protein 4 n=1 Tax=Sphaeramia orbicularis TaxID=375764 RepID=A0A673C228_9TELE
MELFKDLFGVLIVLLACDVTAGQYVPLVPKHWSPPPIVPQQQSKVPSPTPPFDKCQVEEHEKIRCGTSDITPEQCESVNCCFDGRQCYYGKAVTVQCTKDGQFVVVVSRDTIQPPIDVETIVLLESNDPSCSPAGVTSAFAIFQFPVTACGTTVSDEADFVVYENHMASSYEVGVGPRGSITRDSHFELLFQCKYSATAVEALVLEVKDLPAPLSVAGTGPLRVELRLGNGQCHTKGCVEETAAYSSFYAPEDYPITKVMREPIYVEVLILGKEDPNIILTLEHCWATSSSSPHSLPQWDLLTNGCPYPDDHYQTIVVPVDESSGLRFPMHHKRFIMKMFAFVEPKIFSPQTDSVKYLVNFYLFFLYTKNMSVTKCPPLNPPPPGVHPLYCSSVLSKQHQLLSTVLPPIQTRR